MAAVVNEVYHNLTSYTVVDIDIVGQLIKLHSSAIGSAPVRILRASDREDVASDLLISFFSISEQKFAVVQQYIEQYARHAKRGYFQLNYDDHLGCPEICNSSGRQRPTMMQLFQLVYRAQPTALLLPPPPCDVYAHH
eukprot:TRINITY_DN43931_c0_g1_i1.p1 TRINITY_DN43931_c0_g1~~TRINITY_DN43931_c0_g1_i1.p1  ORF type:complete len:146 (-),score=13.86 TRINITY_DN43931_c0_g1_i1:11-424(-)